MGNLRSLCCAALYHGKWKANLNYSPGVWVSTEDIRVYISFLTGLIRVSHIKPTCQEKPLSTQKLKSSGSGSCSNLDLNLLINSDKLRRWRVTVLENLWDTHVHLNTPTFPSLNTLSPFQDQDPYHQSYGDTASGYKHQDSLGCQQD